jgi:transcription elongation GreA/GreB family factor
MIHWRLEAAAANHLAAQSSNDRAVLARAGRELRYWQSRRSTAQVVRAPKTSSEVRFGRTV